jgi:hypothetical protein
MGSLPNELVIHISSILTRRRDQRAFALVSTHFKDIALPLLYRHPILSPELRLTSCIFLLNSSNLVETMQDLTIYNLPLPFEYSFMFKMTCLRSLSMISCGVIFESLVEQDIFVENLTNSCRNLRYLNLDLSNVLLGPAVPCRTFKSTLEVARYVSHESVSIV